MDSNTQEIVRAINRNTDELRRITAELKRASQPVKIRVGPEVQNVTQRLQEPLIDVASHEGRIIGISSPTDPYGIFTRVFTDEREAEDG